VLSDVSAAALHLMSTQPSLAASVRIVALGSSTTAGFSYSQAIAYPARLEALLRAKGYDVSVANAGISGDDLSFTLDLGARVTILEYQTRGRATSTRNGFAVYQVAQHDGSVTDATTNAERRLKTRDRDRT
jgi:hypothetical protein